MRAECYPDPWEELRQIVAAIGSLALLVAAFGALQMGLLGGPPLERRQARTEARAITQWTPAGPADLAQNFTFYVVSDEQRREELLLLLDGLNSERFDAGLAPQEFDILVAPSDAPSEAWRPLIDTSTVRLSHSLPLVVVDQRPVAPLRP